MKWMKIRATNDDKKEKNGAEKNMLNGNGIVQFYITAVGLSNDFMKMTLMNLVDSFFLILFFGSCMSERSENQKRRERSVCLFFFSRLWFK